MPGRKKPRRRAKKTSVPEPPPPSSTGLPAKHFWLPILIIAAGFLAYANSFSGQFVFDDDMWIVGSKKIEQISPKLLKDRRPVVTASLAINYAIGERDPLGYHVVNVAVHLLAALTLFGLVRRTLLTKPLRGAYSRHAPWIALAVALLWVVHPLHTQAVMYIIQRAEAMMGLFYLLTIYCVLRGASSSRAPLWYIAAIASCALGMGCKAVMITAPLVVLLYDRTFLAGSFAGAFKKRWWLYAGLAGTFIVLVFAGVVKGVLNPPPEASPTVGFGCKDVTPTQYLLTQTEVILHYLRLAFWPDPLCLDYAWPYVTRPAQVALPGLVILAMLAATVFGIVKRHPLGFVGAAFFLFLGPTSSFIPIRDAAYEHRMYLPLAAVTVFVVLLLRGLLNRSQSFRMVACGAVLVAAVALGARTFHRNKDYHDDTTIWRKALEVSPHCVRAHYNLGKELVDQAALHKRSGDAEAADKKIDEAIEHYRTAIKLNSDHFYSHNNLGMELAKRGKLKEALPHFRKVVSINAKAYKAWNNIGLALAKLGKLDEAVENYEKALSIAPENAEVYCNLGLALYRQKHYGEAVEAFEKALQFKPGYTNVQSLLKNALEKRGQQNTP